MKRFSALLLLLLLLLSSCTAPTGQGEATSGGDVTTDGEVVTSDNNDTNECMNPTEELLRELYPLLEPSNIHVADIPTDIGSLDFLILADEYETEGNRIFTYYDWASFFVDDESRSVMLIFSEGTLSEIKSFPYSSQLASPEEFEQVTVGTTIAEAVEIVGLPFRSTTSGSPSMDFLASDGTIYRFYANEDLVIHGMYCYNERSNYGK